MAIDRLNNLLSMDSADISIVSLPINKLDFLEDSPFKIYTGDKKEKLIESIKDNGVMIPVIVEPIENSRGRYTILSGANRVDAAIKLNIEEIQAVIKTDLTEDERNLIIVETNLFNRSIDDMLPSELAKSLALRQKSLKRQGQRNDLYSNETNGTLYQKLNEEYKLSERNVRNYIRITYLCNELLDFIDNNVIAFRAGVELSYLKEEEQKILVELIKDNNYKISIDIAQRLKTLSSETKNTIDIKSILDKNVEKTQKVSNFIKIPIKKIKNYIKEEDLDNVQTILIDALKLYYEYNK